ncbi:MAG: ATP-binding cassette domain-containing protein [Armatimonadetes bacterium]|nr:ATP-binding cassette domain-containing protein [Armatimonadota bacterium]MDE2207593.1 ATP-binding cassette domain-containing protein [Armatimonadota bacterium]
MSDERPIVETRNLTRCFGELKAVNSVNLAVASREVFGLLGPNGAGKTTTIKMLTTLLPPTDGEAWVAGFHVVRQAWSVRRSIGYVPQMVSANANLTGYENLLVFARVFGIPRSERSSRIREALAFMGLADAADRLVQGYSGGMLRRLEIAQSMIHRPNVLFLDEPTVGLDPLARDNVWTHLMKLRDEFGATIILTTHYMEEADSLCDRIAIMHLGVIAAEGTPSQLKASIGDETATLDTVFAAYAASELEGATGGFRQAAGARRVANRLK